MKLPTIPSGPPPTLEPPAFHGLAAVYLRTPDLDRSVRFYGGLLALPLVRTEPAPRRYFFGLGGSLLVLEEIKEPAPAGGALTQLGLIVASVEALDELRRRLLSNGVPVSGLENHGYAYAFRFRDPVCGLTLQAYVGARAFGPEDAHGDPEPTPTARELLGPVPS